jgi:hypothetical protein
MYFLFLYNFSRNYFSSDKYLAKYAQKRKDVFM